MQPIRYFGYSLFTGFIFFAGAAHFALAQIPSGFGATPIFDEEFNETSLDTSVWSYRGEGTQRNDCYIDSSAVAVANGYAHISIYTTNNAQGQSTNYCGALTTQNTFLQTYGYWVANVRYQYQPGMQSSFWIQSPTNGKIIGNPQQSGVEMDVFEHTSGNTTQAGYDHALHWNGYIAPYAQSAAYYGSLSNLNDGNFHTFGIAWSPGTLTFYVDGQQTWQVSASDAAISNIAEYIILDTELPNAAKVPSGGYGALGSSTNAYLDVDYVRVYPYSTTVTSTTLADIADAYVQDGSDDTVNYGSNPLLYVKKDAPGYNRNSFLKFDLSQITGTVLQATLYLTPTTVGEANITNAAMSIADNCWLENEITWEIQPPAGNQLSTGINFGADILTNFDVSAAAIAGLLLSVEITGDTPTGSPTSVLYASKENNMTNYQPQLVVISSTP